MGDRISGVDTLSRRQKEILRLISQHLQAKEVARILNISERTVKTHTEEARKRLGVATSRDAARLLVAHEAAFGIDTAIGPDDRWPARPIGEAMIDLPSSDHDKTLLPERTLSPDALERSGDRLANAGGPGQTGTDRRNIEHRENAEPASRSRESDLYHDRGNGLAHGRWIEDPSAHPRQQPGLQGRLARLNALQWIGLILLVGVVSALLMSGLLIASLGALETLQKFVRQVL